MYQRSWSSQNEEGDIILVDDPFSMNNRIGNCWMKGRLKENDILLCVGHSGDSFHDWVLLDNKSSNSIAVIKGSRFGAYGYASNHVLMNSPQLVKVYKEVPDGYLYNEGEAVQLRRAIELLEVRNIMDL